MPYPIYKFKRPASAVVSNSVCGDESVRVHVLGAATLVKVPIRNVRDLSDQTEVNIAVTLESAEQEMAFKLALGVEPTSVSRG